MFGLDNPDKRRGLRSIVMALVVFVLLGFLWAWSGKLDQAALREIARWALAIIGMFTFGYIMENGIRAFKLELGKGGLTLEGKGDE